MKRILCLGDSNTFGYDPRSYAGSRYPPDVRWTGLLRRPDREVRNCGQNGLAIPREAEFPALTALLRSALSLDAVTVMLGTNDILRGASAADAAARMEALLRCVAACAEGFSTVLIAPPPLRYGDWVQSRAQIDESLRLGAAYRTLAGALGIPFADAGEWGVALAFDGVHFTPAGHAAFAAGLRRELDRYLMENRETERENVIKHDNR